MLSPQDTCVTYVYDRTLFPETITTRLNLVCDQQYRRKILGSLMMAGLLVGSILGGWLVSEL